MNETDLLMLALARIPFIIQGARGFRRAVVEGEMVSRRAGSKGVAKTFYVRAGTPGMCDAWVYAPGGVVVEIEAKSKTGRDRDAQIVWRDMCARLGIGHIVWRERKGDSPQETVERWVAELARMIADSTISSRT